MTPNNRMLSRGLAILLCSFVNATTAIAEGEKVRRTTPPEPETTVRILQQTCEADIRAICTGKRGDDAIVCIRENAERVSAPCKEVITKMQGHRVRVK
ncbi:MAG: hypothetical protein EOQ86_09370 [Mesorhizobium sp.]|uniref:hypothetical protein n=1 Tax=Mesorhizobium sp. TaxID=1871066 RepID=UPI000FE53940|nr:hypothetical protein [Mesorhizobium sp.]RWH82171.1 MAG: hypothetical protein EOQ85_07755 [Mesorhizobium sp.]RWH85172.1 MAG: hypothetical protein EOQ86_09370 [Mesorhizobium sp.]RWH89927.1 MAG: hypothetical protein EOQ87_15435 [Mesorhizobium sp.]RWH98323.1 MAG: hypothetical protein EOQ88_13745 [Mesorhizobium sp.]RWI04669.1 MAG: hypothetical protein EOQ89_08815 [Mesorhizobium sp.]